MIASFHNHTSWSDGALPVTAMVARASELGLDEVGISGRTARWFGPIEHVADEVDRVSDASPPTRRAL